MTIPGSANPLLSISAAGAGGYEIERSLRFNSSDSAYLSRTPASSGSLTRWTWAGWIKKSGQALTQGVFGVEVGPTQHRFGFNANDTFEYLVYNGSFPLLASKATTQVFKDPSAWFHLVVVWDSANGTASDRMQIYINGQRITTFDASTDPTPSLAGFVNSSTYQHHISNVNGFNGYLADIYFIDGQALDPTSFRNPDGTPKAYTGTYGTNGFHLDGKVPANLGKDAAGSNDWDNVGTKVTTVDAATLTFADNTQLANFAAGDAVTEVGNGDDATGTVNSVDTTANTMQLSPTAGTWDVGSAVKGPLKASGANAKLYCKLDAAGAVSDLQSADPGFTAWTPAGTGPYTGTVTFPATLPTGNAPDADLPAGTTITVEVQASNTAGTDSAKSNTVTPA